MKHILVIEDDPDIVELLRFNLERESYRVTSATTGSEGWSELEREHPDLVILDLMLPEISGFDLCRRLRRDVPSAGTSTSRSSCSPPGAKRPMSSPVSNSEPTTTSRNPSVPANWSPGWERCYAEPDGAERRPPAAIDETLQFGDLSIDPASHRVQRGGNDLPVTHLEFKLLHHLASPPATGVLAGTTPRPGVGGARNTSRLRSVDVYVRRLRQKIDISGDPSLLKTVRGAGYRFEPPP